MTVRDLTAATVTCDGRDRDAWTVIPVHFEPWRDVPAASIYHDNLFRGRAVTSPTVFHNLVLVRPLKSPPADFGNSTLCFSASDLQDLDFEFVTLEGERVLLPRLVSRCRRIFTIENKHRSILEIKMIWEIYSTKIASHVSTYWWRVTGGVGRSLKPNESRLTSIILLDLLRAAKNCDMWHVVGDEHSLEISATQLFTVCNLWYFEDLEN